jgi:hypothetical protein
LATLNLGLARSIWQTFSVPTVYFDKNKLFGGTVMSKLVLIAVLMLTSSPCYAAAVAIWTAPWTYTPTSSITPPDVAPAFADAGNGAAGAAGELLSGTPAVSKAKAGAMNSSVIQVAPSAKARVDFTRPFTLSGSPGGWDVWLTVLTTGTFTNEGTGASAQLERYAQIFQTSPILSSTFASTGMIVQGGPANCCAPITTLHDTVPDGNYETMGYLLTTASGPVSTTFGSASANFFDTMTVITYATPMGVPENSTWAMMAIGFAGLGLLSSLARVSGAGLEKKAK